MRRQIDSRRSLLRWLLASPLLAASTRPAISQVWPTDGVSAADILHRLDAYPIESPGQAVNVPNIERIAAGRLSPAHFGYIAGGVGDGGPCDVQFYTAELPIFAVGCAVGRFSIG